MAQSSNSVPVVICGVRAFSEEEISHAKTLIFEASSDVPSLKEIRKKNRKNTGHKKKTEGDVEDILHLCYEADRVQVNLPRFAVIDINSFPAIALEEIDGSAVMTKVTSTLNNEVEGVVERLSKQVSVFEKRLHDLGKMIIREEAPDVHGEALPCRGKSYSKALLRTSPQKQVKVFSLQKIRASRS